MTPGAAASRAGGLVHDARRIAHLAWPVFVGQLAVLGFATVDTMIVARQSATELASLAVGAAAYVTVFIGLMGVVMAVGPLVGQLYGAGRHAEAGRQAHQAVWIALVLAAAGALVLAFPAPFLALARTTPEVQAKVRAYLLVLAGALPAALLFSVYRGFNTAVSRPKAVMMLQLGGLALKVPLSLALAHGVPALGLGPRGVVGCALATVMALWAQVLAALWLLRRDAFYDRFELRGHGLARPHRASLAAHLRLGVPMGLGILIEVTGFAFMAIFIARLGETVVAGHQIAANLVALLFMMPLALGHATGALVAQRIGAGDLHDARRLGWHGMQVALGVALVMGGTVWVARELVVALYTREASVAAAALPLLAWVALFHAADAVQAVAGFVLRAWRIATVPMVIYAASLWGVGLAGGYVLGLDVAGGTPDALRGARGFWIASTAGLTVAALALAGLMAWVMRRQRREHARDASATPAG